VICTIASIVTDLAHVVVRRRDDSCVATISGEIDMSNADEIRSLIEDRLVEDAGLHVIDLTATAYLDSAGIRMLFTIAERLRMRGRRLHVVVPMGASVRRLLVLVDLPSRAELHERIADAFVGDH
jgi:anti-sigma B factor antagonist